MKTVKTFWANIYVGLREKYSDPQVQHTLGEVQQVCQAYCNRVGLCVTVTPTSYLYTNGSEPGCIIGLIHYPRFPTEPQVIRLHALMLAKELRVVLGQYRVTVVMPDETVMLEETD